MRSAVDSRSSTTTIAQQFKNPQKGVGPLTRGFAGYRYIEPRMSQVLLEVSNGNSPSSRNPLSPFSSRDKTNVRLLSWPEDPTGSATRLTQWEAEGVVHHDLESIYIMEYSVNGVTVCGVLAEVDLSRGAGSRIVPHEHTDSTKTMGMRKHFSMARIDIEPILLVQRMTPIARALIDAIKTEAATSIVARPPDFTCRMWQVVNPDLTSRLHIELGKCQTLVADGHHRLVSHSSIGHVLAMITDISRNSLRIGAIHRIISNTSLQEVKSRTMDAAFKEIDPPRDNVEGLLSNCKPHQLLVTNGTSWMIASLNRSHPLDISALHSAIAPIFEEKSRHWLYSHEISEAICIAKKKQGVAFLLRPPSLPQVLKYAATGQLLPEKATSFWPKPLASMVVRTF